jgi:hypothetical protein
MFYNLKVKIRNFDKKKLFKNQKYFLLYFMKTNGLRHKLFHFLTITRKVIMIYDIFINMGNILKYLLLSTLNVSNQ